MMQSRSYRVAFVVAIMLHLSVVILLLSEPSHDRPVVTQSAQNEPSQSQPLVAEPQEAQVVKAVSVDSKEVMETVNRLKQERLHEKQAEESRQRALTQEVELARKQRVEEQQRLEKLKTETAQLALAHEKQLAEEKLHLKEVAKQKIEEEKRLVEMKKEQAKLQKEKEEEAKKLADLKKKKADELASAAKENEEKAKAAQAIKESEEKAKLAQANKESEAKAKLALEEKRQAALQQAAANAEKNAQISGEVDKYKALIIGAIGRQWILPENADSSRSSQFRIRLAPNGAVLEVSLTRSSGDPILDRSAQSAIYKASPLPVPSDPETFNLFRDISLTVRPQNARG